VWRELEAELEEARSQIAVEVDFSDLAGAAAPSSDDPEDIYRRVRHDPRNADHVHALFRATRESRRRSRVARGQRAVVARSGERRGARAARGARSGWARAAGELAGCRRVEAAALPPGRGAADGRDLRRRHEPRAARARVGAEAPERAAQARRREAPRSEDEHRAGCALLRLGRVDPRHERAAALRRPRVGRRRRDGAGHPAVVAARQTRALRAQPARARVLRRQTPRELPRRSLPAPAVPEHPGPGGHLPRRAHDRPAAAAARRRGEAARAADREGDRALCSSRPTRTACAGTSCVSWRRAGARTCSAGRPRPT
jgi:hypothetical protein